MVYRMDKFQAKPKFYRNKPVKSVGLFLQISFLGFILMISADIFGAGQIEQFMNTF